MSNENIPLNVKCKYHPSEVITNFCKRSKYLFLCSWVFGVIMSEMCGGSFRKTWEKPYTDLNPGYQRNSSDLSLTDKKIERGTQDSWKCNCNFFGI